MLCGTGFKEEYIVHTVVRRARVCGNHNNSRRRRRRTKTTDWTGTGEEEGEEEKDDGEEGGAGADAHNLRPKTTYGIT